MTDPTPKVVPIRRAFTPGRALLLVSVLLPAVLLALAAWQNLGEVR